MVWQDETPAGISNIFFAFSTDNGQIFSLPHSLNNRTIESFAPQISSSGNNVYVVWTEFVPSGDLFSPDTFFAFSTDNGQTFSSPENLSKTTGTSQGPQISSEGNNVYVVWEDFTPADNFDIFFAVSTDNGQTFRTPENLSKTTENSQGAQISSEGNNVYVVWEEETNEICLHSVQTMA